MKRSELQRIIKEEIRRVLKEGQEPITFSGNKSFMDMKAINVLIKNGIDKASIKRAYDPDEGIVELTVMVDDITAAKISKELETLDRRQGNYGGYITADDVDLESKQPQNELFGFGATKLKEGDKISMTVEPKAGFGAKGQIDKYEMEVIQVAVGGVKVDFIERPETRTLVPEQGWLKSAEGKVGERELKVGDFSRKQFGGTIKSIAVNGKETKGIKW